MKKLYTAIAGFVLSLSALAQSPTPFWTENFENACAAGCTVDGFSSSNGNWGVEVLGTEGNVPNQFYVSCAEGGFGPGACSAPCGGATPPGGPPATGGSLHLSSNIQIAGDLGAKYYSGDSIFTFADATTLRRATSPTINCQQKLNVTLVFSYLEGGDGLNDNATLWYFDGTSWSQIADMPKTVCCGGPCDGTNPGQWGTFSIALPSSADNNPLVRLGFVWENNTDAIGTDPSFAVDNFTLFQDNPNSANTITMFPSILPSYCRGASFNIDYTVSGTFGSTNQFLAILSDANGSFSNPSVLGSITSTTDGSINCSVPYTLAPGTGYRIRVVSSDPAAASANNGFDIEIFDNPQVSLVASGPIDFCRGGSVDLFPSVAGDDYFWNTTTVDPVLTVDTAGSYFVRVTFASNGCSSTSDTIQVNVFNLPDAPTISGDATICTGESTTLSSDVGGVTWNTGAVTQSISVSTAGTYSVIVTDANGCTRESTDFTVTQSDSPTNATASAGFPPPISICTGGNVTLSASVDNPAGVTYSWNTGATGSSITVSTAGDYSFVASNTAGCTATSNTVTVTVAICVPPTQLRASDCGNMNFSLQGAIVADQITGATQYEFEIRDAANTTVVATALQASRTLQLASVTPALQWSTNYNVRVRGYIGSGQGAYGSTCMIGIISDPNSNPVSTTQLQASSCNATNLTLTSTISATPVTAATQYEFQFSQGGNIVATKLQTSNQCALASVSPALNWATTYSVSVRIHIGSFIGPYGNACNITTIANPNTTGIPTTQLVAANCGRLNYSLSGVCAAVAVPNATSYFFEFRQGGNVVGTRTSPNRNCVFSTVSPALQVGQVYTVFVRANISGTSGPFGAGCQIGFVSPSGNARTGAYNPEEDGISMEEFLEASVVEGDFDAYVMPNPFNEAAMLQLQGIEAGSIMMTDATGRIVWEANISGTPNFVLPVGLTNGLYLIRITNQEGNRVKIIKTIKN